MKKRIKNYISKILGNEVLGNHFIAVTNLPFYLLELYDFYKVNLLQSKCLLMVSKSEHLTVGNIGKHIKSIMKHHNYTAIYVSKTLKSYERSRLIEKKIPFIALDNQMYLPMFGLDLREHFKQLHNENKKSLNPLSQVLLLRYLNGLQNSPLTTKQLLATTDYSPMTVNRAFNQLVDYKLATLVKVKREKQLNFILDKATLWQKSSKYLINPIKKTLILSNKDKLDNLYRAGEMALSELTMLTPPSLSHFAMSYKQWQTTKELCFVDVDGVIKLEIWKYDPGLISESQIVDKYSLHLSLNNNKDERIQLALEELLKA